MMENLLNNIPLFISDAIVDSIKLIPSLLIIFVLIEIFERYFSHKIANIVSFSKRLGPILGAVLATIPQCGFSVIMTTLFIKKYITLGTLIAVYIATSDEAIPILLSNPAEFLTVIKIIAIKLVVAITAGYLTDLFIKTELHHCKEEKEPCTHLQNVEIEKGCCRHEIKNRKRNIILHPLKHTLIIFLFILVVCVGINYLFEAFGEETIKNLAIQNALLQPIIFAFIGIIPNCAVSVLLTMMFLKGTISFGAVIAGLISNAGLGLLILFTKKESWKNFFLIVGILVFTAILAGIVLSL
ncbi:MAG: arsenic efflux protein [bacterium]|nr:arsenic efflux protein [bacterium]